MDKKWALPLGLALVALLILWGSLGMGTASKLFPEKPKSMPPVTASEGASSSSMLPQEESRRIRPGTVWPGLMESDGINGPTDIKDGNS